MTVKTEKIIICDGIDFKDGDKICFNVNKDNKTYCIVGTIKLIEESRFLIEVMELDGFKLTGSLVIRYEEIVDKHIKPAYSSIF